MGDTCERCGADLYWNGGIMPSTCTLEVQNPEAHRAATRAYKRGLRDARGECWAVEQDRDDLVRLAIAVLEADTYIAQTEARVQLRTKIAEIRNEGERG